MNDEFKFEIVKSLGFIGEASKGWRKEANIIKWGDYAPKIDIRSWKTDHTKMGKGITLSKEEFESLKNLLDEIDFDSL